MTKRPSAEMAALELLLAPLAFLYAGLMRVRNFAYARRWLRIEDVGVPVVSIGNLTAGGTGKTPLTEMIVRRLLASGVRVGIVSRGYRGTREGIERVRPEEGALGALRFGDEPTWLAGRFPGVPVYVGSDKAAVCRKLLADQRVDLIVADDAFQHRRLHREYDVVVLDASEPAWHYRPLPLGRLREGFSSLKRAQAVFLTKVNLAPESQVEELRARVGAVKNHLGLNCPVFEMRYHIKAFQPLDSAGGGAPRGKVLLVSGIARPQTFAPLVRAAAPNCEIVDHLIYVDHHPYSSEDLKRIEAKARGLGAEQILVTEKDAVKMADWRPDRIEVFVSRLEAEPVDGLEEFYDGVSRLVL